MEQKSVNNRSLPQANMQMVNVKKTDLLGKLKENRAKHAEELKKAIEGYYIELDRIIVELITKFQKDKEQFSQGLHVIESPPQSNLHFYDQAIAMLEYSVDEIITLTAQDVQQYILDNWS